MKDAHESDLSLYTEDELLARLEELSQGPRDITHAMTYECQWEDCLWNDPDAVEGELILREQERARLHAAIWNSLGYDTRITDTWEESR